MIDAMEASSTSSSPEARLLELRRLLHGLEEWQMSFVSLRERHAEFRRDLLRVEQKFHATCDRKRDSDIPHEP
jgi:hypothetical protein